MDIETAISKSIREIKNSANICCWSDKICATCYWYDPNFKHGWCNKNSHETASDSGCSNWASR